jgi:predicted nucleotidyltransferase
VKLFADAQLQDLRELQDLCRGLQAEAVIIGATAYQLFIDDPGRETRDVDIAVSLDLDDFGRLQDSMRGRGWTRVERQEQRWKAPHGTWIDLLPAGAGLRAQKTLTWPESGFVMSLAGFDHVFQDAVDRELGAGLRFRVVTPPVLGLLKMAAYLDDKHRRAKDLIDLRRLFRRYEEGTDRLFSDVVLDANLPDFEFAGTFLLGVDIRTLVTEEERQLVEAFLTQVAPDPSNLSVHDWDNRDAINFQGQLAAFGKGFR